MTQKSNGGECKPVSAASSRSPVRQSADEHEAAPLLIDPLHCDAPVLRSAQIAAVYIGQRVAGDFYEFLRVGPSRLLFVLLDIAGLRADTRGVLIAVQKTFRSLAPILFAGDAFNEITAMIELCHEMNRTILLRGVRSCPAFIGCYNEDLGTVCYGNAGHTPGLLRDRAGVSLLEATGLPLGLFSHTPQSASTCHLVPGSALLVISRGVIDADREDAEGDDVEFGLDGAKQNLQEATARSARDLCLNMLRATRQFTRTAQTRNDLTALALVRNSS
jgi:serine phosphatase RsbU (regulator of sigma subunit)